MGGTATSSQKGLYWTRSYYKLFKCRVLPVVVVAAMRHKKSIKSFTLMCVPLNSFKDLVIKEEDLLIFILPYPSMLHALLTHLHSSWIPHKKQCYKATNLFHSSRTKHHSNAFRAFWPILHQQRASSARKEEEEEAPGARKERGVALRLPDLQSGVSSLAEHLIPSLLVTRFLLCASAHQKANPRMQTLDEWMVSNKVSITFIQRSSAPPNPTPHLQLWPACIYLPSSHKVPFLPYLQISVLEPRVSFNK